MDLNTLREQNRRSWDAVVPAHISHHADLGGFLRNGGITLFPEERELLGDLHGRRLAHLMCNTGQDTLSLARLGAEVTGIDISAAAIGFARQLATTADLPATFVVADVYDWLATTDEPFGYDLLFCSYGAICWLPDLQQWARGIVRQLGPRGRFVLLEFHPVSNMFDREWRLTYDYPANGRQLTIDGIGDYVGAAQGGLTPSGFVAGIANFVNPEPAHLFQWGVGEVVSALAGAGLRIETLREYPFVNGERPFAYMRDLGGRRLGAPAGLPTIPLMYGLVAQAGS